ncbi:M23 family metallopeptidase [Streptomyces tubbatahanensis]|uniref:M23 family metallopeptidase n=1 Tax=Streptomyces tubbatahanensis TaxID=2923272 RepID=A0ABY3XP74_9ACTN|nr:M23 family metallopeptidase [Streptomyces tubbatahanensis]UNS96174.1 M23 family metallopeptidase [Streptomyces tubbatahanensis]
MTQAVRKRRAAAPLAALLCAAVLAGGAPHATGAAQAKGPSEAAQPLPDRIAALYREATAASARFEAAQRKASAQRVAARHAARAVHRGERRLRTLHRQLGAVARLQYQQGGWAPSTRLLTTSSPEALLGKLRSQRQGDHAFRRLLHTTRDTQHRLVRDRAHERSLLGRLKADAARQQRAARTVERRLAQARVRLRQERADRAARAAGPVTRAALQAVPASSSGGCAYSPPPAKRGHSGAKWVKPVKGYTLSAGFASSGKRWAHSHTGQDFAVGVGTPVRAVGAGTVVKTECGGPFGNHIVIRHANGYYTQYAHLSRIQTKKGAHVRAGERIGLSGNTGNSTGPHLHFEVRVTPEVGSGVDPVPWLRNRGVDV